MAQEAIKRLEEQLKCTICLCTFNDPKLLQCYHAYCRNCLVKLVVRDQQGQLSLPCPICRQAMPIPDSGVGSLQPAFQLNNLLEIYNELKKINNQTASPEGAEGDMRPPTPSKRVSYCSEHEDRELELYCETCERLICYECAFGEHHSHKCDKLAVIFEKYKEDIIPSLKPMEENLKVIDTALAQLDERSGEVSKQQTDIEDKICNIVQQYHERINLRKTNLINQIHQITQGKLNDLAFQRDPMAFIQTQLVSCLEFVNESFKAESLGEVLKMKATIVKQAKELSAISFRPHVLRPNVKADMEFSVSPDVLSACQNYGLVHAPSMPDPSKCFATGKGLKVAVVREISYILLHAIDFSGRHCKKPINSLKCKLVSELTGVIERGTFERRGSSQYEISYQPSVKGKHRLDIKVEGQHIKGSPCTVVVNLPINKLGTPILTFSKTKCPGYLAFNQRGEIVVTEYGDHCVSVFSPFGEKLRSFGSHGSGEGQFKEPRGVAVDGEGNILVADRDNHRIQKFTVEGRFITAVGSMGSGPLQFRKPLSIAFNPVNKKVYVGDGNYHIQVLNSDLTFYHLFGINNSEKGKFNLPHDITCDSNGKMYVVDFNNHRIEYFTAEEKFLGMFGKQGDGRGELNCPISVAVDRNNMVYVSEFYNHRISVFTSEGQFVSVFGKFGEEPGDFNFPHGLILDENGVMYVCDSYNNRIQIF